MASPPPGCWAVPGHDTARCTRTAPAGYCPPLRCWCGGCPWREPPPPVLQIPRRRFELATEGATP